MKLRIGVILLVALGTGSCGSEKDVDKIGAAQYCLDELDNNPTNSEVKECVDHVAGINSPGAHNIRCSVGFIREGFANPQRFVDAMSSIEGGTSGSNVQTLMGLLSFTSQNAITTDWSNAKSTFHSCLSSGGKGSTLLASYTFMTMSLTKFYNAKNSGTCPTQPGTDSNGYKFYDLSACIQSSNPLLLLDLLSAASTDQDAIDAQAGIGAVVVSAFSVSCSGSSKDTDLCTLLSDSIDSAGGASNTRQVGIEFFKGALGIGP